MIDDNEEATRSNSDPLERAHLAFVRGEYAEARAILHVLLSAEPTNEEAFRLRELAERAEVDCVAVRLRNESWLTRMQPAPVHVMGLVLLSIAILGLGLYLIRYPVYLAVTRGLGADYPYRVGPNSFSHAPVHFQFALPLALLGLGGYLLCSCIRHIRSQ